MAAKRGVFEREEMQRFMTQIRALEEEMRADGAPAASRELPDMLLNSIDPLQ